MEQITTYFSAKKANELAKSKIPFLDEILNGVIEQARRGLFTSKANQNLIKEETILELRKLGYSVYKVEVYDYDYIIDWELKKAK